MMTKTGMETMAARRVAKLKRGSSARIYLRSAKNAQMES